MDVVTTSESLRAKVRKARATDKRIGFVPTMGALHQGHASLMQAAAGQCDYVVVSIFVNPTQFGPNEDLEAYPRSFSEDCALCDSERVDLVFAPSIEEMYGSSGLTWVQVDRLTETLCGTSRPGHFRGVTTVCTKLFNMAQPDRAFFGQKDAQQALVIERMVADLNMPLSVEICPAVREPDGLAVSSRNSYLNPEQRSQANCLYQALMTCETGIKQGIKNVDLLIDQMREVIGQAPEAKIDYASIVDNRTLRPVETIRDGVLVALAVYLGPARLIDNILVDAQRPQRPAGRH